MIIATIEATCSNGSMLSQDLYRREVLAMLVPLFYIEENYQDPEKAGKELAPIVAKLFTVPDRGVRSILLNTVVFFTKTLDKNALNSSVFEPLCSGFNDSSPVLREMTLKATQTLVPSLTAPNLEKLSRYLVRLQSDAETSLRTNAVVFLAKIAPHLSAVSRDKMLLPAYARSLKDPFSPCRLSALRSLTESKPLFTKQDLAVKVMPCVMPLLLDPMKDVREESFGVVRNFLKEIQEESNLMSQRGDPQVVGAPKAPTSGSQQAGAIPVAPAAAQTAEASTVATTSSAGTSSKSGYLSGMSSWLSSSSSPNPAPAKPTTSASVSAKPVQMSHSLSEPQPPTQQFGTTSLNAPKPAPDGWGDGDDDDDDDWGDDGDDNALAFSNIGSGTSKETYKPTTSASKSASSMGGFGGAGVNDDPFASLGMKTVANVKPRAAKGKLVMPRKAPPAKKIDH